MNSVSLTVGSNWRITSAVPLPARLAAVKSALLSSRNNFSSHRVDHQHGTRRSHRTGLPVARSIQRSAAVCGRR
jgi:hypothetical protein